MNTIGRDKWPDWVKEVVGGMKNIEIKENNGKYYCYQSTSVWNKEKKKPEKDSKYLGSVTPQGLLPAHEANLKGIYEYGNIMLLWHLLDKNGILKSLQEIYPDDWKTILIFSMNRLIDPRPIKSMNSWYEKTYLAKKFGFSITPKKISKVLETVGTNWNYMEKVFDSIREDNERIIYDRSVIFSSSKNNPLLEIGHNKEHLLLTKANIVMAFSHERFLPIFFRVIPGSIHEIKTIDILIEELGENIILVMDKGFTSKDTFEKISKKAKFIMPLKRDSTMINYSVKMDSFFIYHDRPIKYSKYNYNSFFMYTYEDLSLKIEEESTYFKLISEGKKVDFKEEWAGKITLISRMEMEPKDAYEMWKSRDQIEKAFDIFQNHLDVDRPYVQRQEVFQGYLFSSFIGLICYYLILKILKIAKINDKISVSDVLLEVSKVYLLEIGKTEMISERSKKVRKLLKCMELENLWTKNG